MSSRWSRWVAYVGHPERRGMFLALAVVLVLLGTGEAVSPGFARPDHVLTLLVISSFLGLAAAGQTLVILTGGIDLSVSWVLNAASVFLAEWTLTHGNSPLPTVLVLLGAAGVGAVNGLGIAFLRIPPLVMTLGMNSVMEGLVLVYTNGTPQGSAPPWIRYLVDGRLGPVPVDVLVWLGVTLVLVALLGATTFGRRVYAVGNNPTVAHFSGIDVPWTLVAVYALSGLFSALAGILLTAYAEESYLGMGDAYLLPSVAAVVVGGTSILGGKGHYLGTVLGAILLTLLTTLLTVFNIPEAGRDILYGLVILATLLAYGRAQEES